MFVLKKLILTKTGLIILYFKTSYQIREMFLVSLIDLWSYSPQGLYDTCLKNYFVFFQYLKWLRLWKQVKLGHMELHGKPPAKVELYSRFFQKHRYKHKDLFNYLFMWTICVCVALLIRSWVRSIIKVLSGAKQR